MQLGQQSGLTLQLLFLREEILITLFCWIQKFIRIKVHHHHHVPEGLGVFPVPWSSRWSWSVHLFLGLPMFLRPFGVYCRACFGSLFVSILCTCCSHFIWYCFISFTTFCAPVFCLIHWFFALSSFVIQVSFSKISSVLLLNVVPLFSSVPKLHFQVKVSISATHKHNLCKLQTLTGWCFWERLYLLNYHTNDLYKLYPYCVNLSNIRSTTEVQRNCSML